MHHGDRHGGVEMLRRAPSPIPCESCPLRERPAFRALSREELVFMHGFKRGELVVDPGATILLEEGASPHLYTILEGWAFRHKAIEDGRRQVLNFALPGDLVGLQLAIMNEMQHTVTALTRTRLCVFQRDKVWSVFTDHAALGFAMTWSAAREEQLLDGHLLSVGQRKALERVAYLILHLYERAEGGGLRRRRRPAGALHPVAPRRRARDHHGAPEPHLEAPARPRARALGRRQPRDPEPPRARAARRVRADRRRAPAAHLIPAGTAMPAAAFHQRSLPMGRLTMLGWALTFLIVALVAAILGFGGIAGAAVSIAKIIFFVAIVLFAISAVAHLVRGRP